MLHVIVVGDQKKSTELVKVLFEIENVNTTGFINSHSLAVRLIDATEPDVVFFDIGHDPLVSAEILSKIKHESFTSVIVSDRQPQGIDSALKSVKYLLRPFTRESISKVLNAVERPLVRPPMKTLVASAMATSESDAIVIPHRRGFTRVKLNEVLRFEADGAYTRIVLKDRPAIVSSKNLGEIAEEIKRFKNMLRIHRSYIVNLHNVTRYSDSKYVVMTDGHSVTVSKPNRKLLRQGVLTL